MPVDATHPELAANPDPGSKSRRLRRLAWLLVLVSLPLRLIHITAPAVELHSFRQTHNGITIRSMAASEITPIGFETPIFGSPWQLVVDFPLYQMTTAIVVRVTGWDVDLSGRLVSLAYFYLSVWVLYRIAQTIYRRGPIPLMTVLFYLYSPIVFVWSRGCMIESTAVLLMLLVLLNLMRYYRTRSYFSWLVAVVCGCLLMMVKVIYAAVICVPVALLLWQQWRIIWPRFGTSSSSTTVKRRTAELAVGSSVLVGLMLAAALVWKRHADAVNLASPYTAFHAAENLRTWIFGTFAQRFDIHSWVVLTGRIPAIVLPGILTAFPLWAWWRTHRGHEPSRARALIRGAWLGPLFAILIFYPLFVRHDYYLFAAAPLLSFAAAVGAQAWWRQLQPEARLSRLAATLLLGSYILGACYYQYWTVRFDDDYVLCRVGRMVREVTPESEYVIVADFDWHTAILHYAQRRGFMLATEQFEAEPPWDEFVTEPYRTIVVKHEHPELFRLWSRRRLVGQVAEFKIYRVSSTVGD